MTPDTPAGDYRTVLYVASENLPVLEANASDKHQVNSDGCTSILALAHRSIGILEFLLDGKVGSFRANLSTCAALRLSLFQRFEAGDPVDPSYVAMLAYKRLFDALAAGDFQLATGLAQVMGGRPKIEREHDHPFDRAMGYA